MSWIGRLFGGRSDAVGEPEYANALPPDPADIARLFIADYERWNTYAWSAHQVDPRDVQSERSYLKLIAHYCGPAKKPQLPAYGSAPTFSSANCTVGSASGDDGKCTVPVTARDETGFDVAFEFDFIRERARWLLEEVYYLDEYEKGARLKYL
ncbi:hypothetical protein [Qipengyuania marisflavi]|uniref:NTF2 fold immunity protein domain-containing protein n=1 Tax=Qipengyuania marisflavi TaxID=2486356 RepID=A0A5S3P3X2_9SPHN|nr:hypothetical protein [Qipengyuania marisflavi]TMM46731.1 hypothetical protein FEV51_10895 [Qipengyuania marisflavi]